MLNWSYVCGVLSFEPNDFEFAPLHVTRVGVSFFEPLSFEQSNKRKAV